MKNRCTTPLAKLSFNHLIGRTHSWRFSICHKTRLYFGWLARIPWPNYKPTALSITARGERGGGEEHPTTARDEREAKAINDHVRLETRDKPTNIAQDKIQEGAIKQPNTARDERGGDLTIYSTQWLRVSSYNLLFTLYEHKQP